MDQPNQSHIPVTPRLLLVEDDPDVASLMIEALEERFGAGCAKHLPRVSALADADLRSADLVLCDFHLPDGTGLDALRRIAAARQDLPVIMVTGQTEAETAVAAVRAGAQDYVVKTIDFIQTIPLVVEKNLAAAEVQRENRRLHAALNASLAEVREKNRELERLVLKLQELALTDHLTGLANRRRLNERLDQMYAQAVRYGSDLTCMMIDLDGFKGINDTLGHHRGDELLTLTGRVIAGNIRGADVAARYGGDEFVILLPHTSWTTGVGLGLRLGAAFTAEAGKLGNVGLRCGMSVGIASLSLSAPADGDQLIAHADNALYAAKQAGKHRVMICGPDGVTALEPGALAS